MTDYDSDEDPTVFYIDKELAEPGAKVLDLDQVLIHFATEDTGGVLSDVNDERVRQDIKFGVVSIPVGKSAVDHGILGEFHARETNNAAAMANQQTWGHILVEELAEVLDAETEEDQEKELIQLAAVAVSAVENIRRRRLANGS